MSVRANADSFEIVFYVVAFVLGAAGFWGWYFFL
jgi:hypothetical protein